MLESRTETGNLIDAFGGKGVVFVANGIVGAGGKFLFVAVTKEDNLGHSQ